MSQMVAQRHQQSVQKWLSRQVSIQVPKMLDFGIPSDPLGRVHSVAIAPLTFPNPHDIHVLKKRLCLNPHDNTKIIEI